MKEIKNNLFHNVGHAELAGESTAAFQFVDVAGAGSSRSWAVPESANVDWLAYPTSNEAIRLTARMAASLTESEKVVMFTGIKGHAGVSAISSQIALALTRLKQGRVVLLDANLAAPSLHTLFQVSQQPGLSDLFNDNTSPEEMLHPAGVAGLSFIPAGIPAGELPSINSLSLLSSGPYAALLTTLRQDFRYIIINAPPVLETPDAILGAARSDALVLVAEAGKDRKSDALKITQELQGIKVNILGVIICEKKGSRDARSRS